MEVFKPPSSPTKTRGVLSVFLAGSIEMGKAEDWQSKVQEALKDESVMLFNPRRDDWDASWEQNLKNKEFAAQVKWEHDYLEVADVIFLYFDPDTKSPISLMELGLFADKKDIIVICPDGFYRKGNVEFICKEYGLSLFNTLEDGIKKLLTYLD